VGEVGTTSLPQQGAGAHNSSRGGRLSQELKKPELDFFEQNPLAELIRKPQYQSKK
jgi:hypothetical protein